MKERVDFEARFVVETKDGGFICGYGTPYKEKIVVTFTEVVNLMARHLGLVPIGGIIIISEGRDIERVASDYKPCGE